MTAKILVVDDEPNLLRMIGYALFTEGYETVAPKHGEEALTKVRTEQPDLVILDVMLPDMSGIEICQKLRSNPETATLPIIMLSARVEVADKIEGLGAGADEYVTKPVELDEMLARVAALLERTDRMRQAQVAKRGKIFGFIGAKGGVGTTTVALNVALALAKRDKVVTAVELRPYFGTFSLLMQRTQVKNLTDLLKLEPGRINERELRMRLAKHASGLQILFGPQEMDAYKEIAPDQVEAIVKGLAHLADYTIIDFPGHPSPANQAALQHCDFVTVVVEPEPASVQSGKVTVDLLSRWGVSGELVGAVVVNRAVSALPMKISEVGSELGCKVVKVVPSAVEACIKAQQVGVPIVISQPDNVVATALTGLADMLVRTK